MATNRITIDTRPDGVFRVLSDPASYPRWVVGASEIRDVEGRWPEPGSRIHHSVGWGPLRLEDNTESLAMDKDRRLVLEARARPLGRARVELILRPTDGGTEVTMIEQVVSPPLVALLNPVLDPLIHARNVETLRRLRGLIRQVASR